MTELQENWYLKDPIDFELRKYELLSFLKATRSYYTKLQLYPQKIQVQERTEEIEKLLELENRIFKELRSNVVGIDLKRLKLIRENPAKEREYLEELSNIIGFALPLLKELELEGAEIEGFIDSNSIIEPVGLESIYKQEGYLLISSGTDAVIPVFRFQLGLFDMRKQPIIKLNYLRSFTKSVFESFESIKRNIIRQFDELPNPATYVFVSSNTYPLNATLLPVAKRKLIPILSD